jgi:preprotein translocase subunit SecD
MIAGTCEFNRILALALALSCGAGCQSDQAKKDQAKKYTKNDQASLRLYLEVNRDGTDQNEPVLIGREHAFAVNVERRAFLTEFNIEKASIVEAMGGFSISVQFDKEGGWLLDQYTTANKGRHIAIAAEFGQMRWLAAPVITQRIQNGLLVFTPDATREEADRLVSGLNRVAELVRKGRK